MGPPTLSKGAGGWSGEGDEKELDTRQIEGRASQTGKQEEGLVCLIQRKVEC